MRDGNEGVTVWLTGLSAAGKSTLAVNVAGQLKEMGLPAQILDGDDLRATVSRDLGFARADRAEQARRVASLARDLARDGATVLVSLVSPHTRDRRAAREDHERSGVSFLEIHVSTPLLECELRDPKGLYRRARRGEVKDLAGVDYPYEAPAEPDVRVDCSALPPLGAAQLVVAAILERRAARGHAAPDGGTEQVQSAPSENESHAG